MTHLAGTHSVHNISCFHGSEAFPQATTQQNTHNNFFLGVFHFMIYLLGIHNIHNISWFVCVFFLMVRRRSLQGSLRKPRIPPSRTFLLNYLFAKYP